MGLEEQYTEHSSRRPKKESSAIKIPEINTVDKKTSDLKARPKHFMNERIEEENVKALIKQIREWFHEPAFQHSELAAQILRILEA